MPTLKKIQRDFTLIGGQFLRMRRFDGGVEAPIFEINSLGRCHRLLAMQNSEIHPMVMYYIAGNAEFMIA